MIIRDDVNINLKSMFDRFDEACKQRGCFYDITSDESDRQGYLITDKEKAEDIYHDILPVTQDKNIHLDIDRNRKDGILFTFTLNTIQDDGHWQVLSKNPKRSEYSAFANEKDAKRVRAGKTMYQGYYNKKKVNEDQYKWAPGKVRRKQSMWPQAFGRTKSFGGIDGKSAPAIAGSSIPPKAEYSGNIGVNGGVRTHGSGEGQELKPYNKRLNASDNPKTVQKSDIFGEQLSFNIDQAIVERNDPATRLGRPNDYSRRSPNPERLVLGPAGDEVVDGPEDVIGSNNPLATKIDQALDKGAEYDEPSKFSISTKDKNTMRPIGVFGPADMRQPSGGPVSNVRVQHPPDRSFDANSPKITVNRSKLKPQEISIKPRSVGRIEKYVGEAIQRPEDGYEFIQLLVKDTGMVTTTRKISSDDRTYIKACNGIIRLEFDEKLDRIGILTIYKNNEKLHEMEIDLNKDITVDEMIKIVLPLVN